jgi:tetratricopeptide (TPR) repeat protein
MAKLNNHRNSIVIFLFLIAIFSIYLPALHNGFIVNFDDHAYVTGNPSVREGLTYGGAIWAFTTVHSYNWHPLTWMSHMLDVQLFGLSPWGHHLVNIFFHIANSLLLFVILRKLTAAFWRSLFVAALFGLHPLHVESVAWIAERKDMLSTFFGFLAIWSYVDFARRPKTSRYFLVLLFFVLSLMAKQMFVTFPFLLLLLDYWPLQRWNPNPSHSDIPTAKPDSKPFPPLVLEKFPLLILAIGSSAFTYFVQKKSGALNIDTPLLLNMGNALISYVKYIAKMFWPHPLAAIYPFNPDEINYLNIIAAGIFILAASYFALRQIKNRPYFLVGWLWYLGTLFPVIGFVRIGDHAFADRYTYIPLIGLFVALVWGANELIQRLRLNKGVAVALSIIVLFILSFMAIRQTKYWKNDFVLFEHAIEVTENNAPAHKRLGLAYGSLMDVEKATSERKIARLLHYQYLKKVKPNDFEVRYMLGNSYIELQRYDEAISEYLFSLSLNDKSSKVYNNLGIAYYSKGNIIEAKRAFTAALILDPKNKEAIHNLDAIEKLMKQHDNQDITRRGQR